VLAQQRLQDAALAQVDGAADVALVLALRGEDRVRDRHQQPAGGRLVRIADERRTPGEGVAVAGTVEQHALQGKTLR